MNVIFFLEFIRVAKRKDNFSERKMTKKYTETYSVQYLQFMAKIKEIHVLNILKYYIRRILQKVLYSH